MARTQSADDRLGDPDQPDPRRLHLGCGRSYRDGWHNVDVDRDVRADAYHDLDDQPWPWPDASAEAIHAEHILEHLAEPVAAIRECCRILGDGGRLTIVYPIGHTRHEDPTHHHYWNAKTALHFDRDGGKHDHEVPTPLSLRDRNVRWGLSPRSPWRRLQTWRKLRMHGPGGWLDQVTGLYGEVRAEYRRLPRTEGTV